MRYRYSHHRTMRRHGYAVCPRCEGSYWLKPICSECSKGWINVEARAHFTQTYHHAELNLAA